MMFNLHFPSQNDNTSRIKLRPGEMLFVLGANGTGKSSLIHRFKTKNLEKCRKISAHRQTWMNSDTINMTPSEKVEAEKYIQSDDQQPHARYRDNYAASRANMTMCELINAENKRAREIANLFDERKINEVDPDSYAQAPISEINDLFCQSNISISLKIQDGERLMASKENGPEYSAAGLSDGERNALLIAGDILTAPEGELIIIDEPERHLHRSIIAPLLGQLFKRRADCGFVISTHDHDLPLEFEKARTLLLRSCKFNEAQNESQVETWEADELSTNAPIDDVIKRDLLGARRKILFIEGTESSLDKPLYSLIFPMVSVIPKGTCRDVEQAVLGCRAGEGLHWLRAFGIADGDGFTEDQVKAKREQGIYTLPLYSVEAIYYHPKVMEWIAKRQHELNGKDAGLLYQSALKAAIKAIAPHVERLAKNVSKKIIRKLIIDQIPNDNVLLSGRNLNIVNNAKEICQNKKDEIDAALRKENWSQILKECPIRETSARNQIARALGFQKIDDYELSVRRLLATNDDDLTFVRGLFDDLYKQISFGCAN